MDVAPTAEQQKTSTSTHRKRGTITCIVGPMFAGKTTYLLSELRKEMIAKRKVKLVKHASDKRYTEEPRAITHDGVAMDAVVRSTLRSEKDDDLILSDVIGIDEGQFFRDIIEACEMWANLGIRVIVSACATKHDRMPFPNIPILVARCDKIVHLTAVCVECHGEAAFTERIRGATSTPESPTSEMCVGGSETYAPVCRDCYYERGVKRSASSVSE